MHPPRFKGGDRMNALIVATHNKNKLREIGQILPGWEISGEDAGVEETGTTFAET